MLVDYRDRQRSHQDIGHLFNNAHSGRNPIDISQSTVVRILKKRISTNATKMTHTEKCSFVQLYRK